jgi:Ca2+-transporting ATPase
VLLTTLLQMALLYVQPLSSFFGTKPLGARDLGLCVLASVVFFLYLELEKVWRLRRRRASSDA